MVAVIQTVLQKQTAAKITCEIIKEKIKRCAKHFLAQIGKVAYRMEV